MTTTYTLLITGMSCSHCINAVRKALESIPDLSIQEAGVGHARIVVPQEITREQIAEAVSHA
jgi:copper chaperone CopZ